MEAGDRVKIKEEYVGKNGRTKDKDGGLGKIMFINNSTSIRVLLDNGSAWSYFPDEFVVLNTETVYVDDVKYQTACNPITIKAMILSGKFSDAEIDWFIRAGYRTSTPISLSAIAEHFKSGVSRLVDCGFVSVVEEKKEVKIGDRYTVDDFVLTLCAVGCSGITFIVTGGKNNAYWKSWDGTIHRVKNFKNITIEEFKEALADNEYGWKKIYATREEAF
jgi:hypothetical protein